MVKSNVPILDCITRLKYEIEKCAGREGRIMEITVSQKAFDYLCWELKDAVLPSVNIQGGDLKSFEYFGIKIINGGESAKRKKMQSFIRTEFCM